MEGFKNTTKIQYFKEGGFVTKKEFTKFEKKEDKLEAKKDKVSDTKMIKAGVRQHESALHKGEPKTELKLKCGGRMPKSTGTVKKYKTGGTVETAYGAKKTDKDIKDIANTKRQKPQMLCGGKSVGKYASGRSVDAPVEVKNPQALVDKIAREENEADAAIIPNAIKKAGELGGRAVKSITGMFKEKEVPAKQAGGKVAKKC